MDTNILQKLIESIGMSPDGALIGAIGATIAVIWKVNGYGFKSSIVIIVGGFSLCGYLYDAALSYWPEGKDTFFLLMFLIGFISNHIYSFLDKKAPELLQMALDFLKRFVVKKK
jgi:hypothetical protein